MIAVTLGLYLTILVTIGIASGRKGSGSAEDYFLAGRSLGSLVLFMALFGTNVTAFALLGLPGKAYHSGVGVFGFFGANAAVFGPLVFIIFGYPIWRFGKLHGFLTPTQMFSARWASAATGKVVLVLMLLYTIPYIVIGIMGGGIAIDKLTDGALDYSTATAVVAAATVFYTTLGGMRGTAWTNVFQASVFLIFLVVAAIGIALHHGGSTAIGERIASEKPLLLVENFPPGMWATAFLVGPVSVIAFPHMFLRILAARDSRAFDRTVSIYPIALLLLFIPVTLIGLWGAVLIPDLVGKASDGILPQLVATSLPEWLSAVGLAAILAAVMSSLDGQMLALSTLFTVDLLGDRGDPRRQGRITIVALALVAWLIALERPEAIFGISQFAFSGYPLIVPVLAAAFFWPGSSAAGVIVGSLAGHGLLAIDALLAFQGSLSLKALGVMPVLPCLIVEVAVMVGVSNFTGKPPEAARAAFSDPFGPPPWRLGGVRTP